MTDTRYIPGRRFALLVSLLLVLVRVEAVPAQAVADQSDLEQEGAQTESGQLPSAGATANSDSLNAAGAGDGVIDLWKTGISPTRAVLASPVFPGWGQLYAGNSWRATAAFGAQAFYLCNLFAKERRARRVRDFAATQDIDSYTYEFYNNSAEELWEQMRDYGWWAGGALLILALDAYIGAHLFEFDRDPVPVPNRWDEYLGTGSEDALGSTGSPTISVFRWHLSF